MCKRLFIVLLIMGISVVSFAEKPTYYIKCQQFVRPLVEHWTKRYASVRQDVAFKIADRGTAEEDIALVTMTENGQGNENSTIYFGEYAILPFTAQGSEADRMLKNKYLNKRKLNVLFFERPEEEAFEERPYSETQLETLSVYSGNSPYSLANSFAANYGQTKDDLRGKRIAGDDKYLCAAVNEDPKAVSFNAISNLYDLKSRQVKENLTIIGIDLSEIDAPKLSNKQNLDEIIEIIENNITDIIPVGGVGLALQNKDAEVTAFLKWILTDGVKDNHDFGLLNMGSRAESLQLFKLEPTNTAAR